MNREIITYTIAGKPAKVEFVDDPSKPGWDDIPPRIWEGYESPVVEKPRQQSTKTNSS